MLQVTTTEFRRDITHDQNWRSIMVDLINKVPDGPQVKEVSARRYQIRTRDNETKRMIVVKYSQEEYRPNSPAD